MIKPRHNQTCNPVPSPQSPAILPGKSAKCLHMFMRDQPQGFDAKVGHSWYELIYKPLKADIYQDAAIQTPIRKDRLVTA